MTLRAWFRANILAPDPHPTLSRLDRADRPFPSLVPINHDASLARVIDGYQPGPWDNIRPRE